MNNKDRDEHLRLLDVAFQEATARRREGKLDEAEAGLRDLIDQYREIGAVRP